MSGFRIIYIIITLSIILSSTPYANAEVDIEDLIDITELNSKVIAIIKGTKTIPVKLLPNEKVLWSDSSGYLAAFLTDSRFYVISTSSGAWQVLHLKMDEPEKSIAVLSPYLALLVTSDRAIGYSASYDKFIEIPLPLHDELLAAETGKNVAVVVTTSRLFGLSDKSSSFIEVRLRSKETVEDVNITSSKVTVRTSDRLLSFVANSSTWKEHRLN
jgi:hypothetical protein